MSLINNMLKDLEKRTPTHKPLPYVVSNNKQPRKLFNMKWLIFLFASLALLVVSAFVVNSLKKSHKIKIQLTNNQSIEKTPLVPTIESAWIKPVVITGVTLQIKEMTSELAFILDHETLYQVKANDETNQVTLIFNRAKLQSQLPTLNFLTTGIKQITTEEVEDDTKITLMLYEHAKIKSINLTDEEKNPQLVVAVEYKPEESNPVSTPAKLIKTPALESILVEQYRKAINAAENNQTDNAISQLSDLLKVDPTYNEARVSLIALLINYNQNTKAKKIIEEGLNIDPEYPVFIELKSRIFALEGKNAEALNLLQSLSPPINENLEYYALMAALYEKTNNNALAVQLYRQLIGINSNDGSLWLGLGVSLDKLGQNQAARDAYKKAIAQGKLSVDSIKYIQDRLSPAQGKKNDPQ